MDITEYVKDFRQQWIDDHWASMKGRSEPVKKKVADEKFNLILEDYYDSLEVLGQYDEEAFRNEIVTYVNDYIESKVFCQLKGRETITYEKAEAQFDDLLKNPHQAIKEIMELNGESDEPGDDAISTF
jgi:hypothetical protein